MLTADPFTPRTGATAPVHPWRPEAAAACTDLPRLHRTAAILPHHPDRTHRVALVASIPRQRQAET